MNAAETALWKKIRLFRIDDPGVSFKFSDRLARENGWSAQYTHRVIDEYKKFIFLCCVSTTGVTPSDPVDQAWHLHLTYTRSYWIYLCQDTLGKPIHHNPTNGGEKEAVRFKHYYTSSDSLYQQYFGTVPPADIWHNSDKRFTDINFQRINLRSNWVIKKPEIAKQHIILLSIFAANILFVQAAELTIIPVLGLIVIFIVIAVYRKRGSEINKKGDNGTDCTAGCGGENSSWHSNHHTSDSSHHSGDSGCSSGCSNSGCSGCGSD
ncbi:hypothetical protein LJ707_19675 [Mucilaginibacter sp. UR6-1]|uniref:glycine-rich domain-containing protein n=1 Tax=Mucilaginibacter sp. UR6-1 TaxID=1435643 RepID=UPI001E624382|nr:hypothetical protein [Mucilaginibacter sp. UR6-1]MCC8411171.1 hypothetical protein [Mucilaginibacter sp. UR6-1]